MTKRLATWFFGSSRSSKIAASITILSLLFVQAADVFAIRFGDNKPGKDVHPKTVFGVLSVGEQGYNITGTATNVTNSIKNMPRCLITAGHVMKATGTAAGHFGAISNGKDLTIPFNDPSNTNKRQKIANADIRPNPIKNKLVNPHLSAGLDMAIIWAEGKLGAKRLTNGDYTSWPITSSDTFGLTSSVIPNNAPNGPKESYLSGYGAWGTKKGNIFVAAKDILFGKKRQGWPDAVAYYVEVFNRQRIGAFVTLPRPKTTSAAKLKGQIGCAIDSGASFNQPDGGKVFGVHSLSLRNKKTGTCDTVTKGYDGALTSDDLNGNKGSLSWAARSIAKLCKLTMRMSAIGDGTVIGELTTAYGPLYEEMLGLNHEIDCDENGEQDCIEYIHYEEEITVEAIPETGWAFEEWVSLEELETAGCPCADDPYESECVINYDDMGYYDEDTSIDISSCTAVFVKVAVCGDEIIEGEEECDDGNTSNGDGCDAECKIEMPPNCGDGTLDGGEECDDNNLIEGDGCNSVCMIEACGNYYLDTNEECEDGNTTSGDGCSSSCEYEYCGDETTQSGLGEDCDSGGVDSDSCNYDCSDATCGDGYLNFEAGEDCDDNNTTNGDGCSSSCEYEYCGDETTQSALGEDCDNGGDESSTCDYDCTDVECGDGMKNFAAGEECDDGNTDNNDGCDEYCEYEGEVCGNFYTDTGEDCDSGGVDTTTCNADCTTSVCGDGYLNEEDGEECDDGDTTSGNGCSATCTEETIYCGDDECNGSEDAYSCPWDCGSWICGDGTTDPGEECDDTVESSSCNGDCTDAACGDGYLNTIASEECDDGGTDNGDGCNSSCLFEYCGDSVTQTLLGEVCDDGGQSSSCEADCSEPECGDNVLNLMAGEECDDGNTTSEDGCSATCDIEVCGDSITQSGLGETCDDGGESATCDDDCTAAVCGDNVLNLTAGEDCDDGNTTNGDGCDQYCQFEMPSPGPGPGP